MKNRNDYIKIIGIFLLIAIVAAFSLLIDRLPVIGDPDSAPNTHVSDYYIEEGPEVTHSPNLVTGVLADFRGFDTLLETTVMFLAGVAVTMILSNKLKKKWDSTIYRNDDNFNGLDVKVVMPLVIPIILVYAIYVLFHGEVSLGGGFQAGALLAMAFIIYTMFADFKKNSIRMTQHLTVCIAAVGVLIYGITGMLPLFFGGNFLEYDKLPFNEAHVSSLHGLGIFMIETGVTIGVMATIITILSAVLERNSLNERD